MLIGTLMWTLISIAFRNVLRNRRRTAITLAALTLGVFAAIGIRGVLNGLQQSLLEATIQGSTGSLQVHRTGYLKNILAAPLSMDFAADDALFTRIKSIPGITGVTARIGFGGTMTVTAPDGSEEPEAVFFGASAIDPVTEFQVCPKKSVLLSDGATLDDDHLLLGEALAKSLDAKMGNETVVLAPDRDGALSAELSHVGGTLKSFMPGEPKVAIVPLSFAQKLLHMDGRATELAISVDDETHADAIAEKLRTLLGPTFEVHSWKIVASDRASGMQRQSIMLGVVSFVFMVLMLLGVANTTLMSVLERTREIGTLLSIGVTRLSICVMFLAEAFALGAMGTVLGLLFGVGMTVWLNHRGLSLTVPNASVPLVMHPFLQVSAVVAVALTATLGACVFSLYPAIRASRLRPVEALAGR